MSLYISIQAEESELARQAMDIDGKALSRASEVLDQLALELKVKPLMQFFSMDPADLYELMEENPTDWKETWYDAGEGLDTVRALLAYLEDNKVAEISQLRVVADLQAFERVLSQAQAQSLKWHLCVEY